MYSAVSHLCPQGSYLPLATVATAEGCKLPTTSGTGAADFPVDPRGAHRRIDQGRRHLKLPQSITSRTCRPCGVLLPAIRQAVALTLSPLREQSAVLMSLLSPRTVDRSAYATGAGKTERAVTT
jgi:hypothetical protein